ncbi:divalent-cation tolerance protein CutA [Erythrobacter sp.]|jgi:periplasmic divalent cation tolerance protein|uniref:divalent-cation tolerance protein CutA n=1 Tax=Erythrobacter sp. TaxID=1042 RepID=UPI002EC2D354|nr:divalent-cation tolerance protein CutA [Erythrobacter sp.]
MSQGAALVWCPFPDIEAAQDCAAQLLGERLIACANILPAMQSVYEWEDAIERGEEVGVLFKSTADRLDRLTQRLGELHPYDTPAVLGWRCDSAHPATLGWLSQTLDQGAQ